VTAAELGSERRHQIATAAELGAADRRYHRELGDHQVRHRRRHRIAPAGLAHDPHRQRGLELAIAPARAPPSWCLLVQQLLAPAQRSLRSPITASISHGRPIR
jgi:hypothetical protein